MLYPPPPTENIMYTCGDFIPYIAISIPREEHSIGYKQWRLQIFITVSATENILWPKLPLPSFSSHFFVEHFYVVKGIYDMIHSFE